MKKSMNMKSIDMELLRNGIRGAIFARTMEHFNDVSFACAHFTQLGKDHLEIALALEFNALSEDDRELFSTLSRYGGAVFTTSNPLFAKHTVKEKYCREEVILALCVVALEKGLKPKVLKEFIPDIGLKLRNPIQIEAMQDRFPDITDKRIKNVLKEYPKALRAPKL